MKTKIIISLYILITSTIAIFSFYIGKYNRDTRINGRPIVKYQEIEEKKDTSFYIGKSLEGSPYSPLRYENGVIPNASSAAIIAYDYVNALYGEKSAIEEQPYQIQLINDQIWLVDGYLPINKLGGSFSMAIEKNTGSIIYILHNK